MYNCLARISFFVTVQFIFEELLFCDAEIYSAVKHFLLLSEVLSCARHTITPGKQAKLNSTPYILLKLTHSAYQCIKYCIVK